MYSNMIKVQIIVWIYDGLQLCCYGEFILLWIIVKYLLFT